MLITRDGAVLGPVGSEDSGDSFVAARPFCRVSYFSGGAGDYLDNLTIHWECPLPEGVEAEEEGSEE